jgi:ABC-type polysaccharide/polyol phosphate export permease
MKVKTTNQFKAAIADLRQGIEMAPLWSAIGWDQTMSRFRRTILGPFWLSSGLLGMAFALSFVFGGLFGSTDWRSNFEFTIMGVLAWGILGAAVAEGANAFITGFPMSSIQKLPLSFHIAIHMYRTLVNFFCQLIVAEVLVVAIGRAHVPNWTIVPGLILVSTTTFFVSFAVAFPSSRFRDVGYTIGLLANMLFFLTPVFWRPEQMKGIKRAVLNYNPLAHELELIRQPLMGAMPQPADWLWSLGLLAAAVVATFLLLWAFRRRVIFWM